MKEPALLKALLAIAIVVPLSMAAKSSTNALISESSPYLRMHAHNPVDWYPYSQAAFAKAKREDKLIFLSIGFSTCHWCHVMEEESFEKREIAALLNRDYISIKVDKEAMPQIDTYYQTLFSKLQHRRNGWPLSVIMTPDRKVLFMATYLPPDDKYGIEGLRTLLPRLARLYHHDKKRLAEILERNRLKAEATAAPGMQIADGNITQRYLKRMQKRFDKIYKGFDGRPHFPQAAQLRLLTDIYLLDGNETAWKMVTETLDAMAQGGIYDQIEGGFFRYATDQDWVIPHFEKMLYTNAELLQVYLKAYLISGKPLYRKVISQTLEMYRHRLASKDGLFFAATDADSMGEEGGYYTYNYAEVKKLLLQRGFKPEEAEELLEYFDISEPGNFKTDRSNVQFNTGFDRPPKRVEEVRRLLAQLRRSRTYPFIDQKVVTAWNAMMIKTLLQASLLDPRYLDEGLAALHALLKRNLRNGVLYRYTIGDRMPQQEALLEDYAFLVDALIAAYEATYEPSYLHRAEKFAKEATAKFYDGKKWYINAKPPRVETRYLDKYYTTPLPRMLHALLTLASMSYDLDLFTQTKAMIAAERGDILQAFDRSPEALRLLIRLQHGDIVLKGEREKLLEQRRRIAAVRYPFLLTKAEKSPLFLLCNMQACFYSESNLTKVIAKIEKRD